MDAEYKKQLEQFGTEAVRIVKGDLSKKRRDERHEATIAVIRALMERIEGRQWCYAQLDMCRTFTSPFVPGKTDVTTFLSGLQAYGHELLSQIMQAAPEHYPTMLQEEAARRMATSNLEGLNPAG